MSNTLRMSCVGLALLLASPMVAQQSVTLTSVKDNTLYENGAGSLSNGAGTGIFAGRNDNGQRRRAVVQWDLSTIPSGATIQSVQVQLTVTMETSGSEPVALHRVSAAWGEGTSTASGNQGGGGTAATNDATWIHRMYNTVNWTTAGGDFVSTASATQTVNANGTYTWGSNATLVADVQGWLATPSTNHGFIVVGNEASTHTAKRFASHEHGTTASRPKLVVTYTAGTPASVTTVGTGCVGVGGQPLTLAAVGLPTIGNATFGLTVSNGTPGAPVLVFHSIGLEPTPVSFGGCLVYLNIASLFERAVAGASPFGPVLLNGTGTVTIMAPIANVPGLSGVRIDVQALSINNLSTASTITSNALTLIFGV